MPEHVEPEPRGHPILVLILFLLTIRHLDAQYTAKNWKGFHA